jgi:cytoskeletal protein CcmA (bactofilin family)
VNADGDVMLAQESQVEADIRAQNVSVAGRFKGSIIVKGRAELARGGRVDGNITAKTLVVEEGGIFQGQSIMDQQAQQAGQQPGQQPARRENIPEAERAKV